MSWRVDPPRRFGTLALAAITRSEVSVRTAGRAVVGRGDKHPLMVLVARDGAVSGIDISGRHVTASEIEKLYPQAIAQMQAQLPPEAAP